MHDRLNYSTFILYSDLYKHSWSKICQLFLTNLFSLATSSLLPLPPAFFSHKCNLFIFSPLEFCQVRVTSGSSIQIGLFVMPLKQ